jgi:hypothetical protein
VKRRIIAIAGGAVMALLFISSCKKDNKVPPLNLGYNYFPNNVGHYVIYNADSMVINAFTSTTDTFIFQIKEVIDSIFMDGSNRPTQRLVRYKRPNDTSKWVLEKVWSANLTATDAEKVEDNIRYVRLIFPPNLNASWNGNGFNTMGDWEYQYTAVDVPLTLNSVNFDSTLTVVQLNNHNGIQNQYYEEQYARNIGLIYKQITDETSTAIFGPYTSGVIYTETYVSSSN